MAYEPTITVEAVNARFSRYVIADRPHRCYWGGTKWTEDACKALLYAHAEVAWVDTFALRKNRHGRRGEPRQLPMKQNIRCESRLRQGTWSQRLPTICSEKPEQSVDGSDGATARAVRLDCSYLIDHFMKLAFVRRTRARCPHQCRLRTSMTAPARQQSPFPKSCRSWSG
jgi:hypothetical protein